MEKKMPTKTDLKNLEHCPKGRFFNDIEVWPRVKRLDYSLGRLVSFGLLIIDYTDDGKMYKVKEI